MCAVSLALNEKFIKQGDCCCDWNEGLASDVQFPLASLLPLHEQERNQLFY
jgi:hypothetical protein